MTVRTRFAPSPTGRLHIGGIRTALYSQAMAKHNQGQALLRIEDTDQTRFSPEGLEEIYAALDAYNLNPDESDRHGGNHGPYTQSKRLDLYQKYVQELIEKGGAYYCFLTSEEEENLKAISQGEHRAFRSPHRDLTAEEVAANLAAGKSYTVRQRIPAGRSIDFVDGVQGAMHFSTDDVDEGVLLKSDGFPTYHLAMLVDDHLMEITDVFRAFEWIPSIPKHVLLYETMGWEMPRLYHLSTILDPEGGKLSKRKGATAAIEFLAEGYLPEAVLNFLMFLGWSSPEERTYGESEREIYSLSEFIDIFDPKDLNKSNPTFDRVKLLWFNQKHISLLSEADLEAKFRTWVATYQGDAELTKLMLADLDLGKKLKLIQERVKLFTEIPDLLSFFYNKPTPDFTIDQLKRVPAEQVPELLKKIYDLHAELSDDAASWQHSEWEPKMRALADAAGLKHGDMFMLLRIAIAGSPFSPPMFESLQLLGREEVLARLQAAL